MSKIQVAIVRTAAIACASLLAGCLGGELRDQHASVVERYVGTPFVDDSEPFADPTRALGPPDGRTVALGLGATLELRFFRAIPDGAGPDLRIVEVGPDGSRARISVSADGEHFRTLEDLATDGGPTIYDLEEVGLEAATTVRLQGLDNSGPDPGFDLDAVEALN